MVKLYLSMKGELNGVTDVEPLDTEAQPFEYMFKIECTHCRTVHNKNIGINRFDTYELSNSRGDVNFMFKCKECKSESNANIIKLDPVSTSNKWARVLEIDSRGLDFVEFVPQGKFVAKGEETSTPFELELEDNEWYEYDDKAGEEVSIVDVEWKVERT